jgi:tetratricopeptide (TPR) repeat protein
MKAYIRFCASLVLALAQATALATTAADFDQELAAIIRDYDKAYYDTPNRDAKSKAFEAVAQRAANLAKQHPNRGEPVSWQGQSLAEQSAVEGSLGLAKQARKALEAAIAITPNAYASEAYSTLGSMYANMPGFPLAFGDKKKAREYFQKALAINSSSIGANVGYAQLLLKTDDYAGAMKHATAALNAPPRLGREKADKAARARADSVIAKAKEKLR